MDYGDYIKGLREAKGLTLRDVEKKVDVSNAYLSQLESNKVKQPSPAMLYKLSMLYEVPYELLMERVGYPVPKQQVDRTAKSQSRFGKLTKDEETELLNYLKFIRQRKMK